MGTNPPVLEDSVVSGRGGDKERLRKTTIVSQYENKREKVRKNKSTAGYRLRGKAHTVEEP